MMSGCHSKRIIPRKRMKTRTRATTKAHFGNCDEDGEKRSSLSNEEVKDEEGNCIGGGGGVEGGVVEGSGGGDSCSFVSSPAMFFSVAFSSFAKVTLVAFGMCCMGTSDDDDDDDDAAAATADVLCRGGDVFSWNSGTGKRTGPVSGTSGGCCCVCGCFPDDDACTSSSSSSSFRFLSRLKEDVHNG